jgi:hypothetical protein
MQMKVMRRKKSMRDRLSLRRWTHLVVSETLEVPTERRLRPKVEAHEGRLGENQAIATRENTLEDKSPRELRTWPRSKPSETGKRIHVWRKTLKTGTLSKATLNRWNFSDFGRGKKVDSLEL